jgi:hypothetical protein
MCLNVWVVSYKIFSFIDNVNIIIYHLESDYFKNFINDVSATWSKWSEANGTCINLNTGYDNRTDEDTFATKFLGFQTGGKLNRMHGNEKGMGHKNQMSDGGGGGGGGVFKF